MTAANSREEYDAWLSQVLEEESLKHRYLPVGAPMDFSFEDMGRGLGGGLPYIRDHHQIYRTEERRVLWDKKSEVAAITSEPRFLEPEERGLRNFNKYDGLTIEVRDPDYNKAMQKLGERFEFKFREESEIITAEEKPPEESDLEFRIGSALFGPEMPRLPFLDHREERRY